MTVLKVLSCILDHTADLDPLPFTLDIIFNKITLAVATHLSVNTLEAVDLSCNPQVEVYFQIWLLELPCKGSKGLY